MVPAKPLDHAISNIKCRLGKYDVIMDHVERKVPKYENHKLRERKVKTLTSN